MADAFTGERFLPECTGEIAYEHWHRYVFARHVAAGKKPNRRENASSI
jgi:hypothetical protein